MNVVVDDRCSLSDWKLSDVYWGGWGAVVWLWGLDARMAAEPMVYSLAAAPSR